MNYYLNKNKLIMRFSLFSFIGIMLVTSCGGAKLMEANEYLNWCNKEKSSFTVSDSVDQVVYQFTYVSNEEDAANCLLSSCLTDEEINNELKSKQLNQQFKLRIRVLKPGMDLFTYSKTNYVSPVENRQKYFAFEMKKDIHLITKMGDTVDCNYWFYEPSVAGSGFANIECSFQPISRKEMKSIVINDLCFTGNKIEIKIDEIPYSSYPTLKIKSKKK